MRRSRISSSAPAASSASAISCSGSSRTPSCISPPRCGPISTPQRSTRRLLPTGSASGASVVPASSCRKPRRTGRAAPPCLPQPTLKRLFLTRVLTAAILLAAFIAALFWLPHALFALLISAVIGLAGHEWARLCRLGAVPAAGYATVCGVLCFLSSLLLVPAPWIFTLATAFWLLAAPARLARGPQSVPAGLEIAAGLLVLVPAGLAAILLEPVELLMVL